MIQGLENGLVDALGGEAVAIKWLTEEKGVEEGLEVIDWKPQRPRDGLFDNPAALVLLAQIFGVNLDDASSGEIEKLLRERLLLDGLVSIWQVSR